MPLSKPEFGFDRLLILPNELTARQILDKITEVFTASGITVELNNEDLSEIFPEDVSRTAAVWVRDRVESDIDLGQDDIDIIPMIFELKYLDETGNHLDVAGYTHCVAHLSNSGTYPVVSWYPSKSTFIVKSREAFGFHFGKSCFSQPASNAVKCSL